MDRKTKVLFLCGEKSCRSQMAEGVLRSIDDEGVEVYSAGVKASKVHPTAVQVMKEEGIDISGQKSRSVGELDFTSFDLIITLCDKAREYCNIAAESASGNSGQHDGRILITGNPARIHWPVPDPEVEKDKGEMLKEFRNVRDMIRRHIEEFVHFGFLDAIARERGHMEQLLDLLQSGIIVHDENRRIYLFNKAAQDITGVPREEVLGMDCHAVFPPDGICGSQCKFMGNESQPLKMHEYDVVFTDGEGKVSRLSITSEPMEIDKDRMGILAVIRDVTELSSLREQLGKKHSFHNMIGVSPAVQEVFDTIRMVSASDYSVLISGESGTGKELVARAVHNESRRSGGPFVPVNCGALPENILESEIFGHVRGAFTGAIRDKKGRFELADRGTLFLDEVGELPPAFQVKLLRVLQEQKFERVGGEKQISVDVRVISATNRDLRSMVEKGQFREDLFYRLCVVPVTIPPLRQRTEDIPHLVEQILGDIREETGRDICMIDDGAMDMLLRYAWPGNIRELINALQYASVRCRSERIRERHLPPEIRNADPEAPQLPVPAESGARMRGRRKLTVDTVRDALDRTGGNKLKAAKILGVGRATLYRFLNKNPVG